METIQIEDDIIGIPKLERIDKDTFFNILNKKPEGLALTIEKVNKPFNSKFQDPKNKTDIKEKALYIHYLVEIEGVTKRLEISYYLGYPIKNECVFKINETSLLFKLLCLTTPNLKGLSGVTITYNKLVEKLTGLKFIALSELVKKHNGYNYIINPVKLI